MITFSIISFPVGAPALTWPVETVTVLISRFALASGDCLAVPRLHYAAIVLDLRTGLARIRAYVSECARVTPVFTKTRQDAANNQGAILVNESVSETLAQANEVVD